MVRGRVERIENDSQRRATFSRRKKGLLHKAEELSVLCDAEVAVIIFTSRGKLWDFGSNRITQTLERYQRCSNLLDNNAEGETQSWLQEVSKLRDQEVSKLKAKYESLQRTQRHSLGEDLGTLSLKELQNLEKQLEGALVEARQRKTQIMMEQMEELRRKGGQLGDMNKQLKLRISQEKSTSETEGQSLRSTLPSMWNGGNLPNQVEIEPEPILQIGKKAHDGMHMEGDGDRRTEDQGGYLGED